VGQMGQLKRKTEFKKSVYKAVLVNDTRFGLRKLFLNQQDKPKTFSYNNPGRNWHGYN
jgi:hypothetical protein